MDTTTLLIITGHSAAWRRRLVRPGPLVLSNETRTRLNLA